MRWECDGNVSMITSSDIKKNTQGMLNELLQLYKQQGYIRREAQCLISKAVGISKHALYSLCVGKSKKIDAHVYLNIHQYHQEVMGNT